MAYQQYQYHPYNRPVSQAGSGSGTGSGSEQQHYSASPQASTPFDFLAPPPSPWDATLEVQTQDFDDTQLIAAMAATAGYAPIHQHSEQVEENMLPPITTLEMTEAQDTACVQASALEDGSTPTTKKRNEEAQARQNEYEYEPPKVIQLPERSQRRTRTRTRQQIAQEQAQTQTQAQKRAKTASQTGVQGINANTLSPTQSPIERSGAQHQHQPHQQTHVQTQSTSQAPFALATSVPPPGAWFDMNALAATPGLHSRSKSAVQASRTQARQAAHPYARQRRVVSGPTSDVSPGSKKDEINSSNVTSPTTSLQTPNSLSISNPLPYVGSSPSSTSSAGHAATKTPSPSSRPPATTGPRYLVRTDVHYDIRSNTLTAMLEIPGVPRAAIRVALGLDAKSGNLMLIVRGRIARIGFGGAVDEAGSPVCFAPPSEMMTGNKDGGEKGKNKENLGGLVEGGYVVKERKCGEFKRMLVVPHETKPEHIKVSMADGILFLRYPAGPQPNAPAGLGIVTDTPAPSGTQPPGPLRITITTQNQPQSQEAHTQNQMQMSHVRTSPTVTPQPQSYSQLEGQSPAHIQAQAPLQTIFKVSSPNSGSSTHSYVQEYRQD